MSYSSNSSINSVNYKFVPVSNTSDKRTARGICYGVHTHTNDTQWLYIRIAIEERERKVRKILVVGLPLAVSLLLVACTSKEETKENVKNIEDVDVPLMIETPSFERNVITVVYYGQVDENLAVNNEYGEGVQLITQNSVNPTSNTYIKDITMFGLSSDFEGYFIIKEDEIAGVAKTKEKVAELLGLIMAEENEKVEDQTDQEEYEYVEPDLSVDEIVTE